jgi:hypothetical protein
MLVLERGVLELDFDPNLLLEKIEHVYQPQDATLAQHCGVCKARNKILRAHPTYIHFDAENDDFMDDAVQWNVIHPDEVARFV